MRVHELIKELQAQDPALFVRVEFMIVTDRSNDVYYSDHQEVHQRDGLVIIGGGYADFDPERSE